MNRSAVIGGGVAGSAVALHLARRGKPVTLVEREVAAHHKVCGEFISAEAVAALRDLGIDLAKFGAAPIDRLHIIHGKRCGAIALPFCAYSLSRKALDEALLQQVANAGVELRRGVAAQSLIYEEGWQVILSTDEKLSADRIFLATGKHDLRGYGRSKTGEDYIGFKLHFVLNAAERAALSGAIELYLFDGGYAGLEPVEDGRANLCLVIRKQRFATYGKSWEGLLEMLRHASPLLRRRLQDAAPCWDKPLAIFGIPYGFVFAPPPETEGLYRLGDQMGVIPSLCGDGIAIALHTARLAAAAESSTTYHHTAKRDIAAPIRRALWGSRALALPPVQALAPLLHYMPGLARLFIRGTRMPGK